MAYCKILQILLKFQVMYKFSSCVPFAAPLGKGIMFLFCLWPRLMPTTSFNHLWDQYFCSNLSGAPNNYYSQRNNCSHLVHKASIKSPEGGRWKRYFILKAFKHCTTAAFQRASCHSLPILFLSFSLSRSLILACSNKLLFIAVHVCNHFGGEHSVMCLCY